MFPPFPVRDECFNNSSNSLPCLSASYSTTNKRIARDSTCQADLSPSKESIDNQTPFRHTISVVPTAATTPEAITKTKHISTVDCNKNLIELNDDFRTDVPGKTQKGAFPQSSKHCNTADHQAPPMIHTLAHRKHIPRRLQWFLKLVHLIQQGPDDVTTLLLGDVSENDNPCVSLLTTTTEAAATTITSSATNKNSEVELDQEAFPTKHQIKRSFNEAYHFQQLKHAEGHDFCLRRGESRCAISNGLIANRHLQDVGHSHLQDDFKFEDNQGTLFDIGSNTFAHFEPCNKRDDQPTHSNTWCVQRPASKNQHEWSFCRSPEGATQRDGKGTTDETTIQIHPAPPTKLPQSKITQQQQPKDTRWASDQVLRICQTVYRIELNVSIYSIILHSVALIISAFIIMFSSISAHSSQSHQTSSSQSSSLQNHAADFPGLLIFCWLLILVILCFIRHFLAKRILHQISKLSAKLFLLNLDVRPHMMKLYRSGFVTLFRLITLVHIAWLILGFVFLIDHPVHKVNISVDPQNTLVAVNQSRNGSSFFWLSFDTWISNHFDLLFLHRYCVALLLLNVALFGVHLVRTALIWIGITFSLLSTSKAAANISYSMFLHPFSNSPTCDGSPRFKSSTKSPLNLNMRWKQSGSSHQVIKTTALYHLPSLQLRYSTHPSQSTVLRKEQRNNDDSDDELSNDEAKWKRMTSPLPVDRFNDGLF